MNTSKFQSTSKSPRAPRSRFHCLTLLFLVLFFTPTISSPAAPKTKMAMPDFTKEDPIPDGASHDWNLGPTGARGWMFSDQMVTTDARQIAITEVAPGSPADGVLEVGDVILGVAGKPFAFDPRTELGKAITTAETEVGAGKLSIIRWRDGKDQQVVIPLPIIGTYSSVAPFNCPKSKRILEEGCAALAKRMTAPNYKHNPIPRSLNALALLASGNPDYLPLVKKEAQWAADFSADSFQTWYYGYTLMLLSEYVMATGDQSVVPGMKRLALEAAEGQSIVGSWGHKFAQSDGRLVGYGMMNAPGLTLTTSLVMARAAGIKDPKVDTAIERSARLLRFYTGKGAIPYGDHSPWMQTHEDNGKCGMAAVLFNLLNEPAGAEFFARMSLASHGAERDTGHTGNFFNILWSLPAVALSGEQASGAWMNEFGAWYFDLARRWDGSFAHLGPPQMRNDSYHSWDCSGAYLLAYAIHSKQIYLTGKRPPIVPQLNAETANKIIADGQGWSNKDRDSAYAKQSDQQLLGLLSSWSPIVRERAATALGQRKTDLTPALIKLLDDPKIETRYGACRALAQLGNRSAPAVPDLQKNLQHEDLWLRVQAAEALANIGTAAMVAAPELLERLALPPSKTDPRGMEQRYLSFAIFDKMLKRNSLDAVDPALLQKAITAGLKNEDGRARSSVGNIYQKLSYEEIKPLLPAIHEAIVTPAPSGIMFASGVRLSGVELLAKHRIREGMALSLQVMEIDKWGKGDRIKRGLKSLQSYGGAAKAVLPQLRQLEKDLSTHKEARMLKPSIDQVAALINEIENSTDKVELRDLNK